MKTFVFATLDKIVNDHFLAATRSSFFSSVITTGKIPRANGIVGHAEH
jgi:hypothetical protein